MSTRARLCSFKSKLAKFPRLQLNIDFRDILRVQRRHGDDGLTGSKVKRIIEMAKKRDTEEEDSVNPDPAYDGDQSAERLLAFWVGQES